MIECEIKYHQREQMPFFTLSIDFAVIYHSGGKESQTSMSPRLI